VTGEKAVDKAREQIANKAAAASGEKKLGTLRLDFFAEWLLLFTIDCKA
jgi:hypothetical protein